MYKAMVGFRSKSICDYGHHNFRETARQNWIKDLVGGAVWREKMLAIISFGRKESDKIVNMRDIGREYYFVLPFLDI